jgi:hypothetical protein
MCLIFLPVFVEFLVRKDYFALTILDPEAICLDATTQYLRKHTSVPTSQDAYTPSHPLPTFATQKTVVT